MGNPLVKAHQNQGRFLQLGEHQAFVYEKGEGDPVVCIHGVPSSSFLYRKMIDRLAEKGFKGIAFDLLGMGLSDRPVEADYSWTGLGNWVTELIKKLKLGKFHLIIHDIGGPIGVELIAKMPEQITSVTILNTPLINLASFKKPIPMFFFAQKNVGEIFIATTTAFLFQKLMHMRGIHRKASFSLKDAQAYLELLKGADKAKAFLKIMRSFEATAEKEAFYIQTLNSLEIPKQIVWGINDPGLSLQKYGEPLQKALHLDQIIQTQGSHFLQEDYADEIVAHFQNMPG